MNNPPALFELAARALNIIAGLIVKLLLLSFDCVYELKSPRGKLRGIILLGFIIQIEIEIFSTLTLKEIKSLMISAFHASLHTIMKSNSISNGLKRRLKALDRIYGVYDDFIKPFNLACRPRCATCCTCNMTLTTLEGYRIISHMNTEEQTIIFEAVGRVSDQKRYKPHLTINQIAGLCRDGHPVPEVAIDPAWGSCPLLKEDACPVYEQRPFGCRCMVSNTDCRQTGYADVEDAILTVNNILLQYIEHVDSAGMTGNLVDILIYFATASNRAAYENQIESLIHEPLTTNHPVPVLMVPPEHRQLVQPILGKLQRIDV